MYSMGDRLNSASRRRGERAVDRDATAAVPRLGRSDGDFSEPLGFSSRGPIADLPRPSPVIPTGHQHRGCPQEEAYHQDRQALSRRRLPRGTSRARPSRTFIHPAGFTNPRLHTRVPVRDSEKTKNRRPHLRIALLDPRADLSPSPSRNRPSLRSAPRRPRSAPPPATPPSARSRSARGRPRLPRRSKIASHARLGRVASRPRRGPVHCGF